MCSRGRPRWKALEFQHLPGLRPIGAGQIGQSELESEVTSLNVSEPRVAEELVESTRGRLPLGLVLADGNYDRGRLYDCVASVGGRLLTPLPKNAGGGHRRQSSSRLVAAEAWKGIAGYVYRDRLAVERFFAHQSAYGGGLALLPAWARTLPRVRRWVGTSLSFITRDKPLGRLRVESFVRNLDLP